MRLGKVTQKDGQTWITLHERDGGYTIVHLDCPVTSVELKGTTLNVKTR